MDKDFRRSEQRRRQLSSTDRTTAATSSPAQLRPSVAGSYDVYLIRTDSHGDTLWTKTFGGSWSDAAWSVQQTADSGFVVAGTWVHEAGAVDAVYVVKTDPSGDTLWTRFYGGLVYDNGYSVRQTEDGGYIVAGYSDVLRPTHERRARSSRPMPAATRGGSGTSAARQ